MTLQNALIGNTYIVKSIDLDLAVARRLEALGLTKGTGITVLNRNRSGSVIIKVRGSRLAVGKSVASLIQMREA